MHYVYEAWSLKGKQTVRYGGENEVEGKEKEKTRKKKEEEEADSRMNTILLLSATRPQVLFVAAACSGPPFLRPSSTMLPPPSQIAV